MKRGHPASPLLSARLARGRHVVMVVDDDWFTRVAIRRAFGTRSHVIELERAADVIHAYLEYLPDIVFLDIHLPGGSGLDVLDELLSFDETAHIVMLSADSLASNVLQARRTGARDFLVKPFTPQRLEECYSHCGTTGHPLHAL